MKASILFLAGLLAAAPVIATGATPRDGGAASAGKSDGEISLWQAWGGEIQFRWNRDLAGDYGFAVSPASRSLQMVEDGIERLELRDTNVLTLAVRGFSFDGFRSGRLAVRGGFDIDLADGGRIPLQEFSLQPRAGDPMILDVVASDGVAWFYIDRLMYKFEDRPARLSVLAMDLRIGTPLAARLGQPDIAGHAIAAMSLYAHVHGEGFAPLAEPHVPVGCGKWHGCSAPGGQQYEADVFMDYFYPQYYRRDADADGPGGSDGRVVFVPSSTLRNNRNNGTAVATRPGDPLGTSSALYAANIPWYSKFTGNFNPHGNDQHPFLIWNLYRIDADGRISQVGRSGVKHAWLTTNIGCDENPSNGHILGRGCGDTYGTGNNDEITDLGPRSEIAPAQGIWGRCGSVYDSDCNGIEDPGAPCTNLPGFPNCTTWAFRMGVRESKIDPAQNADATYLFESWYIVREDINIYNTMQTRPVAFQWNGSSWPITCRNESGATVSCSGSQDGLRLGPAIDRWMPRGTSTATERSSDIDSKDGRARVAARVTPLGGGQYRYDYVVMNFDFAKAVISGTNPNLRVESNNGFVELSLLVPAGANLSQIEFDDGDIETANDWPATRAGNTLRWSAVPGNELNWGTMYRFSFVSDVAPVVSDLKLTTADPADPAHPVVLTLGPGGTGVEGFTVGGTASRVAGTNGADLQLNGTETLTVSADGAFHFVQTLQEGDGYDVTLTRHPNGRSCVLEGAQGTISGNVSSVELDCVGYGVSGTATGVTGTDGLELRLNGAENLTVPVDGGFAFATPLMGGEDYTVTVARHPAGKTCLVDAGFGQIGSADVTNVSVNCTDLPPDMVTIGGQLAGLEAGRDIELRLNGGSPLVLASNGPFVFPGTLPVGGALEVVVSRAPFGQDCTVSNGSGTVPPGGVSDVLVQCVTRAPTQHSVRVNLSGLAAGEQVRVQLNGANTLALGGNGSYVFGVMLTTGTSYTVTVSQQPATQTCTVANGQGTIDNFNITNVAVSCVSGFSVGGSLVGLPAQETVQLGLNGAATLSLSANGPFEFAQALPDGAGYTVELLGSSAGAQCSLSGASGTIAGAHVDSVQVQCQAVLFGVSGEVSGLDEGQDVTLRLNGGETLAGLGNGAFAFTTGLPNHTAVQVEVVSSSGGAMCSVLGGSTVQGADVDDIQVVCGDGASGLFADGFED